MLKKLIEYFVLKLVDKPEVVTVTELEVAGKSIIEIRVAPADFAKIIGKEGQTFKALRTLVNSIEPQSSKDVVVDIIK